jgi:ATP synthase protein I
MGENERDKSRSQFAQLAESYREVAPYLGLGLQLAVTILIFLFIGRWVDGKLGTAPWFMVIGAFLGGTAGMYSFIRTVIRLEKKDKEKKDSQ